MELIEITNKPAIIKFQLKNASLVKSDNKNQTQNSPNKIKYNSDYINIKNKKSKINSDNITANNSQINDISNVGITEYKKIQNLLFNSTSSDNKFNFLAVENFEIVKPDNVTYKDYNQIIQTEENLFKLQENEMEYIPWTFTVEIIRPAEVLIEYIGGYNYVPPNSAPDYVSD